MTCAHSAVSDLSYSRVFTEHEAVVRGPGVREPDHGHLGKFALSVHSTSSGSLTS